MTRFCQWLTSTTAFQRTSIGAILFAGLLVGLETDATFVARHRALLHGLDLAILSFFILELAVRVGAYGTRPLRFFTSGWNTFDFAIVALCLLPAAGPFASVLRLARVLRLLRLVSALPKLQLLVGALLKSLGAMGYVGILLGLMAYVYAVVGVHLFGPFDPKHFGTLGATLFTLFQIITLDNWGDIFSTVHPHAPVAAVVYFVSYILLGTMIMLNLFIGIIMNSMSSMHSEMEEQAEQRVERNADQISAALQLKLLERQIESARTRVREIRKQLHEYPPPAAAHSREELVLAE